MAANRVARLQDILRRGAQTTAQAGSVQTILRRLCGELVADGMFLSSRVGVMEADGTYRGLTMRGALGPRAWRRLAARIDPADIHESVSALAWRTAATHVINDIGADSRFAPWHGVARQYGVHAVAVVPIFRGGKRWAVLGVDAAEPGAFDGNVKQLVRQLAGMIGRALDELDQKSAVRVGRATPAALPRLDGLGLPNRLALDEYLHGRLAGGGRRAPLGIGIAGIDGMRRLNDNFGNEVGDLVLRKVYRRLATALRDIDFVARPGGDWFALMVEECNEARMEALCQRLVSAVRQPVEITEGRTVSVSITIGFTLFPLDDSAPDALIAHAGMACAAAKAEKAALAARGEAGTDWKLYQDLQVADRRDSAAVSRLLAAGAVVVHYQPLIDVGSGRIVGVEALARLRDGGRLLYPNVFLGGCTVQDRRALFHQVLAAGLGELRRISDGRAPLSLGVNVDSEVLLLDDTLSHIEAALRQYEIAPPQLLLEILETHDFVDLQRARDRLREVRLHGVRLALDDLGAGYSSVLKLRDLPIDVVKLDRAFTAGLRQRPDDLAFISAFQMLTATLGMMLVVEGVETAEVLDALRMMGGGLAQGYGIARPMPGPALAAWMWDYSPPAAQQEPKTLLGAYAVHLNWLQSCRLHGPGGPVGADRPVDDPVHLDGFLTANGFSGTSIDLAYRALRHELRRNAGGREEIQAAAERFRHSLTDAIAAQG
jgi:diguanylate cyclase (GGDEF)-like protein